MDLLVPVRETRCKDLPQYVLSLSLSLSLSLFHLKTETDPFTEMLCFVKPESMEMFHTLFASFSIFPYVLKRQRCLHPNSWHFSSIICVLLGVSRMR